MSKLIAGPFVGEFGWELFCWQGRLRHKAKRFDKVICAGRPGRGFLYADFAQYVPIEINGSQTDCVRCQDWTYNDEINHLIEDGDVWIKPQTYLTDYRTSDPVPDDFKLQEFVKYGQAKNVDKKYDVVIHARWTDKHSTGVRNWSRENWQQFVNSVTNAGHTVAAIGSPNASIAPDGVADLRGMGSEEVDIIAAADVTVGGSSGPMHLASLCGCPQVVWGSPDNKRRYEVDWNPFKTEVRFIGEHGWHPPVITVFAETMKILEGAH